MKQSAFNAHEWAFAKTNKKLHYHNHSKSQGCALLGDRKSTVARAPKNMLSKRHGWKQQTKRSPFDAQEAECDLSTLHQT